ncbi:hypothetical protein FB451DRAFT_1375221 [Mycena latifolia]|nr:hypothetical protein FB451DRAFT_1375221 [Mycena latifolia]
MLFVLTAACAAALGASPSHLPSDSIVISVAALALTPHFRRDYSGFQASPAVLALVPALAPAPTHCQLAAALSPRHAAAFLAHPFVLTCHQPPPALPRSAAARRSLARSTPPALCALSGRNTDPSELRLLIPFRKPVDFAVPTPPHPPTPQPPPAQLCALSTFDPSPPHPPRRPRAVHGHLCFPISTPHAVYAHPPYVGPPAPAACICRVYCDPKILLASRGPRRFLHVATIRIGTVTVDDTLRVK